jgi:hypothetical protein
MRRLRVASLTCEHAASRASLISLEIWFCLKSRSFPGILVRVAHLSRISKVMSRKYFLPTELDHPLNTLARWDVWHDLQLLRFTNNALLLWIENPLSA